MEKNFYVYTLASRRNGIYILVSLLTW